MNPDQTQGSNTQLTQEEAKASLGMATALSQQHFNPKIEQSQKTGKKGIRKEETKNVDKEDEILSEVRSLREELESLLNEEDAETE